MQIVYTEINRDSAQTPHFSTHYYGVDPNTYFYPASTVKLPIAILALEKLRSLSVKGITPFTTMLTDSSRVSQQARHTDLSSANGLPSLAHDLRKLFLVSDNEASNRLYEFVGQAQLNERLQEEGFSSSKISHRLSAFLSSEENRYTNPIRFVDSLGQMLHHQDAAYSNYTFPSQAQSILMGKGYIENGKLISQPKDFSESNRLSAQDMQEILKATLFPEIYEQPPFHLSQADYALLYTAMGQLPGESDYPAYDVDTYYDSYCKFFLYGNSKEPMPDHVRIFNKVGQAYGYLIDNAYIIDTQANIEFLLTAVVYVNANGIFNDDLYEYDEVGFPFLAALGKAVYHYELQRNRQVRPDLSRFEQLQFD